MDIQLPVGLIGTYRRSSRSSDGVGLWELHHIEPAEEDRREEWDEI